jgi:hypothetical protein
MTPDKTFQFAGWRPDHPRYLRQSRYCRTLCELRFVRCLSYCPCGAIVKASLLFFLCPAVGTVVPNDHHEFVRRGIGYNPWPLRDEPPPYGRSLPP